MGPTVPSLIGWLPELRETFLMFDFLLQRCRWAARCRDSVGQGLGKECMELPFWGCCILPAPAHVQQCRSLSSFVVEEFLLSLISSPQLPFLEAGVWWGEVVEWKVPTPLNPVLAWSSEWLPPSLRLFRGPTLSRQIRANLILRHDLQGLGNTSFYKVECSKELNRSRLTL